MVRNPGIIIFIMEIYSDEDNPLNNITGRH